MALGRYEVVPNSEHRPDVSRSRGMIAGEPSSNDMAVS